MTWKGTTKDKVFGKLTVCVTESKPWREFTEDGINIKTRAVIFHYYREKTPWWRLTKSKVGSQFTSPDAFPLVGTLDECVETFIKLNKMVSNYNKSVAVKNEHHELKQQLANPAKPYHLQD